MSMSKQARLGERVDSSQQVSACNFNQGPSAAQTGLEADAGTGAALEPKQVYPSAVSQKEGKGDDRDVPERRQYWPGTCTSRDHRGLPSVNR
jgi:hypothetical protein